MTMMKAPYTTTYVRASLWMTCANIIIHVSHNALNPKMTNKITLTKTGEIAALMYASLLAFIYLLKIKIFKYNFKR